MAIFDEVAELIQVGLYQPGTSFDVDTAIEMRPQLNHFLQQNVGEVSTLEETLASLEQLFPTQEFAASGSAQTQTGGN